MRNSRIAPGVLPLLRAGGLPRRSLLDGYLAVQCLNQNGITVVELTA